MVLHSRGQPRAVIQIAVSQNLNAIAQATGISISELHASSQVSEQTLTKLFKGKCTPNRGTLWRLSTALGCSPNWLVSNYTEADRFKVEGAPLLDHLRTALKDGAQEIQKRVKAAQHVLAHNTADLARQGALLPLPEVIRGTVGRPRDLVAAQRKLDMGERIQTLLIYANRKVSYLCNTGASYECARSWARGKTYPCPSSLIAIASLFGITPAQLEGKGQIDPKAVARSAAATMSHKTKVAADLSAIDRVKESGHFLTGVKGRSMPALKSPSSEVTKGEEEIKVPPPPMGPRSVPGS